MGYKIEQDPEIVDLTGKHGHRSRDVNAAYLRGLDGVLNVPGVIAPTHLLGEAEKAFYAALSSYTLADLVRPAAARQVIKAAIASAE